MPEPEFTGDVRTASSSGTESGNGSRTGRFAICVGNFYRDLADRLIEKCGSVLEPRFFKPQLRKVVEDDDLPDYHITMSFDPRGRGEVEEDGIDARRWATNERILVSFWPRGGSLLESLPADP